MHGVKRGHSGNRAARNLRAIAFLAAVPAGIVWGRSFAANAADEADAAPPAAVQAAITVSFDEESGNAAVMAAGDRFDADVQNDAGRVPSPFWNQSAGRALELDASKKQVVQFAGIPFLDRPDAVTLSFLFINLHPLDDDGFHGLVAKRSDEKRGTNYGINFHPKNDSLQLYVHDGSGYKSAVYSVRESIGHRRRVHLAASFDVADAPESDEDSDRDDLRIRLYVNAEPVAPKSVSAGFAAGADAWLTDVDVARLLNDAPVTLGASTPQSEFTSGVFDEFALFARALSADEVARVFQGIAGEQGAELARREASQRPAPSVPEIDTVSLRGLQAGLTTRLTIRGRNFLAEGRGLAPMPQVVLPVPGLKQTVVAGSTADRLIVDVAVPAEVGPGIYPLAVQAAGGISNMLPVAIDRLPQLSAEFVSRESPVTLPAAVSGSLSGDERVQVHFFGYAGQRIVANVEARRLGATFDPVLELKTGAGKPQAIEWGQVPLKGDARAELVLPETGLHAVELHDLAYKAPANSPFRLTIGDIKMIDTCFPPAAASGSELNVEPIGIGLPPGTVLAANLKGTSVRLAELLWLPPQLGPTGPAPAIRVSDGTEVVETAAAGDQPQSAMAAFGPNNASPLFINGRISQPAQEDHYVLAVTPGQKLNLAVQARSIDSPLDGQLTVLSHPDGQKLASSMERPGTRDPGVDVTVPENVQQLLVTLRDLHGRGGPYFLYRLRVAPAGQPSFSVRLLSPRANLPMNGSALVRLNVTRDGYNGPIALSVAGNEHVTVSPSQIPAEGGNREVLITLNSRMHEGGPPFRQIQLLAESVGIEPPIRTVAVISASERPPLPGYDDQFPVAFLAPVEQSVQLVEPAEVLLKGLDAELGLEITMPEQTPEATVRLSLVTNETVRPVDPRDGSKGNKPLIRGLDNRGVGPGLTKTRMKLTVPTDVAEGAVDCVIRADLVPHAYSETILASTYTAPFRPSIREAASADVDKASLTLKSEAAGVIRGTLKRTPPFAGAVEIKLLELPDNYQVEKVSLPADQVQFEIPITPAKEAESKDLSAAIEFATTDGRVLNSQRVQLRIEPPALSE